MPKVGSAYYLSKTTPHTQLAGGAGPSIQTLVLDPACNALLLSARTASAYITFDNSAPAAGNGIEVQAAAQPVLIPLGYAAHSLHTVKFLPSAANGLLNVVQLD